MTTDIGRVIVAADADALTPRQQEVVELLAQGLSNHEIAVLLVVSDHTVRSHLEQIFSKLATHTRTETVVAAQALGLVPSGGELHPVAAAILVLARLRPSSLQEAISVLAGESGES